MSHRRGLVVGKFAPLHRGHVLLVEHALTLCEELWIVSYSKPELPGCEPERRRAWLERQFPGAQDGTRRDAAFRDQQHRAYLERLAGSGSRGCSRAATSPLA